MLRGKPLFSRATLGLLRPNHQILDVDIAGQMESVGSGVTRFKAPMSYVPTSWTHGYGDSPRWIDSLPLRRHDAAATSSVWRFFVGPDDWF
jgi:hypothetical protein